MPAFQRSALRLIILAEPNLTGMAVHPKAELLTQIVDPSRNVEGNYRTYTVVTAEGQIITGMLASETRTSTTIIDAKAKDCGLLPAAGYRVDFVGCGTGGRSLT